MDFLDFSSYDWNTWSTFLQEHWLVLVIALVVLLLIIRVVKTVVKWALVAVIVLGVVLYSGYSLDDLKSIDLGSIGSKVADGLDSLKKEAVTAMAGEVDKATFATNADGTYTVKTDNLELTGVPDSGEVSVSYRGTKLGTMKIDSTIQTLIDQAKNNGKA